MATSHKLPAKLINFDEVALPSLEDLYFCAKYLIEKLLFPTQSENNMFEYLIVIL